MTKNNTCLSKYKIVVLIFILAIGFVIAVYAPRPSNDRDWTVDNAVLPYAEFHDDSTVTIHNIRNFSYTSVFDFTPAYYDKTFNLDNIRTVDFFNEPFSGVAAHTFLSFGFGTSTEPTDFVAVSVEVRREKGESFNAWAGLFNNFELMYVIADERDVLRLRTNYRKGDVYRYPINVSQAKSRALFVDMLTRADKLYSEPEFYNTLTNTCTTNIVDGVNNIADTDAKISLSWKYIFPKYSAGLAYDLGLLRGEGSFEDIQSRSLITPIAQKYNNDPDFSLRVRGR